MKIIVAVIVYDRFKNIKEWIRCWKQCDTTDAELIIIHNFQTEREKRDYHALCHENKIKYVPRSNVGMDIGAFQDVCRGRLNGFPNQWDYLLWVTDDVIPMNKNFISLYVEQMKKPTVGVACLELSKEVKLHIRTTGFMIDQETASKIEFPAPKIINKAQCYDFEHRSRNAFYEQVRALGKNVSQVTVDVKKGYLWDTHIRGHFNRWKEHEEVFPIIVSPIIEKKVTVICPIYQSFPQIISSLICQTHKNWSLILIHDGQNSTGLAKIVENYNDSRVFYIETPERKHNWGHHLRKWALNEIKEGKLVPDTDYIVITNPDNYYIPTFMEEMVKGFTSDKVATYCSSFVHGYTSNQPDGTYRFGVLQTKLELGWLDCGGAMVKKDVACDIGWESMEIYSDWEYFKKIITKYGKDKWAKVLGCLFVHN